MFKLPSLSELCYITFGSYGIYIINGLLAFATFGFTILFEILFSNLALSVVLHSELIPETEDSNSKLYTILQKR